MGCGASSSQKYQEEKPQSSGLTQDEKIASLGNVELFKRLPESEKEIENLAKVATEKKFAKNEEIIKQGDAGSELFVIVDGKCKVEIDGKPVTTFEKGHYFGEVALTRDQPRTATITAETGTVTLCLSRKQFMDAGLLAKLEFPKRQAVAVQAEEEIRVEVPAEKNDADIKQIVAAIQANENLSSLATAEASLKELAKLAWVTTCTQGQTLITQGDSSADYFYIVKKGSFQISTNSKGNFNPVGDKTVGSSFGELALLYSAPRAANVTAKEESEVWVIARNQFKRMQVNAQKELAEQYKTYLKQVEIFKNASDANLDKCAKALDEKKFLKDEFVFEQGHDGDYFYILLQGKVDVIIGGEVKDSKDGKEKVYPFGEKALDSDEKRAASIKVTSDEARCLALDKISYELIVKGGGDQKASERQFGLIKKEDLTILALLGCGGFGAVELVVHKTSEKTYALKRLSKGFIVKSGMQASVIMEKNVQLMCDSDFIVKLFETYNGKESLYLLLELALGGELYATYNKLNLWGKIDHAKFYVAGTVFAFEHLHEKKIIFRDLKPENLLLNEKGQVKLTDMGLAKVTIEKTFTTCGTPDYFAPEIITSKGHTKAVDWWTLGILSFELLVGHPPFESATPMQIYQKVRKGIQKVKFPSKMGAEAEAFIKGLCTQDPQDRMPMRQGGIKNIRMHKWYSGFDWEKMKNLTLDPPYKPKVKDPKDHSNFSARKDDLPPQIPYKDPGTKWDKDFATCAS